MTRPRPTRLFNAEDILNGRVSLDGYPFRYISVQIAPKFSSALAAGTPSGHAAHIDLIFSACELLESRGWEVVTVEGFGRMAHLRRRAG